MSTTSKPLDIFQDLYLRGPTSAVAALRQALKDRATPPWRYATEKEEQLRELGEEGDALAFERAVTPGFEAAGLVLIADDDGLKVANIVPRELSELTHRAYNAILADFASEVARPAAVDAGYSVVVSNSTLQLENVVSPAVAEALRRFSVLANKSTGASHPLDRDRWFDFILWLIARMRSSTPPCSLVGSANSRAGSKIAPGIWRASTNAHDHCLPGTRPPHNGGTCLRACAYRPGERAGAVPRHLQRSGCTS